MAQWTVNQLLLFWPLFDSAACEAAGHGSRHGLQSRRWPHLRVDGGSCVWRSRQSFRSGFACSARILARIGRLDLGGLRADSRQLEWGAGLVAECTGTGTPVASALQQPVGMAPPSRCLDTL